jgi:peroxiredoxin family protein
MAATSAPDKLSIVVHAGDYGRVHYALAMASAASAMNKPVTLFFTMAAIRALTKHGGWRELPAGDIAPDLTGGDQDLAMAAKGLANFEELLEACIAFKVKVLVCEMGLRAVGLTKADLRDDIPYEDGGIVSFLADASATGSTLFI